MLRIAENAPLGEKFKYAPKMLSEQDIRDALIELDAWRAMGDGVFMDTPEEFAEAYETLCSNQENPDHANYDDLKSFFEDCVESLNKRWPAAEPYDQNLRQVIMNAITRGDVEEEGDDE